MRPLCAALVVAGILWGACGNGDGRPAGMSPTPFWQAEFPISEPSEEWIELAQEVPGFVGFWFDPVGNTYNVNSVDQRIDLEALKQALLARDPTLADSLEAADFNVIEVAINTVALSEPVRDIFYTQMPEELRPCLFSFGVDGLHDRIVLGVSCEEARTWLIERLREDPAVPFGAVIVEAEDRGQDDEG